MRTKKLLDARYAGFAVAAAYLIVLLIAGLRMHVMSDGDSESDFFGAYVVQARSFLAGDVVIDAYRGPLYPIALGLFGVVLAPLGAGLFETGIFLSAVSAAVTLLLFHMLAARALGTRIAILGTLLIAANPIFVRYSYTTGTDMFFVALAYGAVVLTLSTDRLQWRRAAVVGVVLGLAYLTRYNGAVLLAAALLAVVVVNVWRSDWKRRLIAAGVVVATFALVITPWGWYRLSKKGDFFYDRNHMNVAYSLLPEGTSTDHVYGVDISGFDSIVDVIVAFPGQLLGQLPTRGYAQFVNDMGRVIHWPLGFFVIVGLLSLFVVRPTRRETAYYVFALCFFSVLLMVFYGERFGLFLIPAYAMLGARAVLRLPERVEDRLLARVSILAAAALIVVGLWTSVDYNRGRIQGGDIEIRQMGEWFVENQLPGGVVAARKPVFAYFAGLEPIPLPMLESHDDLLDYLNRHDADYLLFSYVAARTRLELGHLVDYKVKHPGLEAVAVTPKAILYRVERP